MDDFTAFLADAAEVDELFFRADCDANFFFELSDGRGEMFFTRFNFSLGDTPMAVIFSRKKGTAWMRKENLQGAVAHAV